MSGATSWAKDHPWMTFFLISGAVSTVGMVMATAIKPAPKLQRFRRYGRTDMDVPDDLPPTPLDYNANLTLEEAFPDGRVEVTIGEPTEVRRTPQEAPLDLKVVAGVGALAVAAWLAFK
jgi:hypothetical protein